MNYKFVTLLFALNIANLKCFDLPRKIGQISVKNAAFLNFRTNTANSNKYDLLISTFTGSPFSGGNVEMISNVGDHYDNFGQTRTVKLAGGLAWPNEVAGVPDSVFGKSMVVIPDGFLVPFHTKGAIYLVDISTGSPQGPYKITGTKEGNWFYHRVLFKDMDGDGDLDIVTCRAREPIFTIFSSKDSELLWLENPDNHQYTSVWQEHVITHGPDVYFRNLKIATPDGTLDVIATTEFFTRKLSIHWTTDSQNRWTDKSKIHSRVVDSNAGALFDIEVRDLNLDGKQDLLVVSNGNNGSVLAYEIPDDFRVGKFERHTLATGFTPATSGTGKGAPGSAFGFYPMKQNTTDKKPYILVSGDDDGKGYILEPSSSRTDDWSYLSHKFVDVGKGTVGQFAFADVNADGYTDIVVPAYNDGTVSLYTFAPSMSDTATTFG
ncbi:unnamed protein product [Mytilus edulis]|uniref:VCBS repeat-containing protein n=1 Tax=Mytilus edulis TaxID=6550 RepID=A0A8S3QNC1_MYTED|nr:unnamed protein product [Mytilus edulis]